MYMSLYILDTYNLHGILILFSFSLTTCNSCAISIINYILKTTNTNKQEILLQTQINKKF